jgi:TnpA family transposase
LSSSDGQFFQAGGHGTARSEINARYGGEPGVSFYSHLSDQFGAFYTKVIAATAHEAPHIDGRITLPASRGTVMRAGVFARIRQPNL